MARVKGTAVLSSLRHVRERFGEEPLARILSALPAEDSALRDGVLASSWYPMAERQLGREEPNLVSNMGRASCDYGVTGVYKIFFKVGSPEFCVHRGEAACRFEGTWD